MSSTSSSTGTDTPQVSDADVVGGAYGAFGRGDIPGVLAALADDIAWHVPGRHPLSGDYTGHEQVLGFFGALVERSEGTFTVEVSHILDGGDGTVAALVTEFAHRNGADLNDPSVHVWRLVDGKAASFQAYHADDHAVDAFWA